MRVARFFALVGGTLWIIGLGDLYINHSFDDDHGQEIRGISRSATLKTGGFASAIIFLVPAIFVMSWVGVIWYFYMIEYFLSHSIR
jgi:hypothetical protein